MGKGEEGDRERVWEGNLNVNCDCPSLPLSPGKPGSTHLLPCWAISSVYSSPLVGFLAQASLRELGVQETRERGGGEGGGWRVEAER